jgi:hypothetical protein
MLVRAPCYLSNEAEDSLWLVTIDSSAQDKRCERRDVERRRVEEVWNDERRLFRRVLLQDTQGGHVDGPDGKASEHYTGVYDAVCRGSKVRP